MIDVSRWAWIGVATADEVVQAARSLIDTPFVEHARLPGIGTDCIGVGVLTCRAAKLVAPRADIVGYPMVPDGTLLTVCDRLLIRSRESVPGGMGIFIMGGSQAHHLGIFVPYRNGPGLAIVHALGPGGRNHVTETRLLSSMRFVRAYKIPGVAY